LNNDNQNNPALGWWRSGLDSQASPQPKTPADAGQKKTPPAKKIAGPFQQPRDCLFVAVDKEDADLGDEEVKVYAITPAAPGWLRADAMELADGEGADLWNDPAPVVAWLMTSEGTFPVVVGEAITKAPWAWEDAALIAPSGEAFGSDEIRYRNLNDWLEARGACWREAAMRRAARAKRSNPGA